MKAVILAGGLGTRISEETSVRPKPMVEIGGRPVLWHIMKIYSAHNIHDFIICLGYKGYMIKEYFANYFLHMSDVTFDMKNNGMHVHQNNAEPWRVTLIDTGEETMTGGRLRRVHQYLDDDDFCFTYGDGVGQPPGRFGSLLLDKQEVIGFNEKPEGDGGWINGGFFVLNPKVIEHVDADDTIWERGPMEQLARDRQLAAYFHHGFWQPMDTLRDKRHLEELWNNGCAPWKLW
jgi:glucose-1-phosphate cytidylyltransferase